ncbi:MAG: tail protein X [Oscillospiraceae bacterium]|nr:tail protein X [Oscillospiraceae bacterium]
MSKTYTTKSGDMWDLIAHEQMGSGRYTHLLLRANASLSDTVVFSDGVKLVIPEVPLAVSATLPPWRLGAG